MGSLTRAGPAPALGAARPEPARLRGHGQSRPCGDDPSREEKASDLELVYFSRISGLLAAIAFTCAMYCSFTPRFRSPGTI